MAYARPESTPICPCHDRGSNPADCETGHVSECHYPFDCRVAACGHFPHHEYTELESEAIERRAENLLTNSADQDCPHYGGWGCTEQLDVLPAPEHLRSLEFTETHVFYRRICRCVVGEVERSLAEDDGETTG